MLADVFVDEFFAAPSPPLPLLPPRALLFRALLSSLMMIKKPAVWLLCPSRK
jgi:hypothetical protein